MISKRLQVISPSATLALNAKVQELAAEGKDVVKFGVGEPDFPTPDYIKKKAVQAIEDNKTTYTAASGIPELKKAVCRKFAEDNGLEYQPSQILVSVGAKHSIYNALMALVDDGDEVLVPAPYWVSYPEQVKLAGGVPVVVQTTEETDFKVTPKMLEDAISSRTRAIILNSPSNPSGSVYTEDELAAVGEVLAGSGVFAICDEIYEFLVYDGVTHVSLPRANPDMMPLSIVINGVSKAYAMTGWRIGYAAGPEEVIKAMGTVQSHATSNATSISQWAALAALEGPKETVAEMVEAFDRRRVYMTERLQNIRGFECTAPKGAFYVFPNVGQLIGDKIAGQTITDGDALAEILLNEVYVAVVPGSGFGAPENVRFSYSTSMEKIEEGMDRIEEILG
jgi:aspartate aminotransferase